MCSFDFQLKRQNAEWSAPKSPRSKIARRSQGALKVMRVLFFSRSGLGLTIPCQLVRRSMAGFTVHSCRIMCGRLFAWNYHNCWSVVSFCFRTVQHPITTVMCKIWCNDGTGRCWHFHPTFQMSSRVITGCLHVWKKVFGANDLNQKMIPTLLSLPLYIVLARMTTEL